MNNPIKSRRSNRPAYTEENAMRFKPVFDYCIKAYREEGKKQNIWLNPETLCLSLSTYQNRISEALRFLCDQDIPNSPYKTNDYIMFRNLVRFKQHLDLKDRTRMGILIKFRDVGIPLNPETDIVIESESYIGQSKELNKQELFKLKIQEFFDNPAINILELRGVGELGRFLTPEDIVWVENTFNDVDIMCEVRRDYIKAMKG